MVNQHGRASTTPFPTTTESTAISTQPATSFPQTTSSNYGRQDLECHLDYMEVYMPVSLVPHSQLSLKDPACQLQNNGTHHVLSFSYDSCGTSVSYFTDYVFVQNEITVHSTLQPTGPVVFHSDYTIPLQCQIPRHQNVDSAFQAVTKDPIVEINNHASTSDFAIREYRSALFRDEITQYPVQVPMNREAFMEVGLTGSSNNTGIRVNHCTATPTDDPNDPVSFLLVQDGCSATPAVTIYPRPNVEQFRFGVQVFHFSGSNDHNGMVYIHCDVGLCMSSTCVNSCTTRRRRRRRRSVRHAVTVSSGPTTFLN